MNQDVFVDNVSPCGESLNVDIKTDKDNSVCDVYQDQYEYNTRTRSDSSYGLRSRITQRVCNSFVGNRSDLYQESKPLVNSTESVVNVSTIRLLSHYAGYADVWVYIDDLLDDLFSEEILPDVLTNIWDATISNLIKDEVVLDGTCGKCRKYFSNWSDHIDSSLQCFSYDAKCNVCNIFFCGTKGLRIHNSLVHKPISVSEVDSRPDSAIDIRECRVVVTKVSGDRWANGRYVCTDGRDGDNTNDCNSENGEDDDRGGDDLHDGGHEDGYRGDVRSGNDDLDDGDVDGGYDGGDNVGGGGGDDGGNADPGGGNYGGGDGSGDDGDGDDGGGDDGGGDGGGGDGDGDGGDVPLDDGDDRVHVRKCISRGCGTCPIFHPVNYVHSPITKRKYDVVNHSFPEFIDCSSTNVVYLLSCNNCDLQYIGQTGRKLRERIREHKAAVRSGRGKCPYLIKHFNSGPCEGCGFSVSILEKIDGSGLTDDGKVDKTKSSFRRERETDWMLRLRSVFPYGMNHDVGKNLDEGDLVVGTLFPKLSVTNKRTRSHTRNFRNNIVFNLDEFLIFIDDTLNNDLFNAPNIFRMSTLSLKKTNLKLLRQNILTKCRIGQYKQWYQIIVDIIETQLYKPIPPKVKRKPPKYRLKCLFTNKAFDFINLPKLLRAKSTLRLKPDEVLNDEIPMVVFKLVEPIRSTIMNYSKFVSSLDIDQAFNDIESVPCSCHEFDNKFVDDHHQHILTGNLEIIEHVKLRNLIRKGPKYREPEKVDFTSVLDQIDSCLDMYIEQIAKPKKLEIDRFRD